MTDKHDDSCPLYAMAGPAYMCTCGVNSVDCGAPVLSVREENGEIVVTTERGTFPITGAPQ